MKTVDTKGMKCPQPLVMAKKALKEVNEGDTFSLITDNEASKNNLKRFLSDNGIPFTVKSAGGIHTFLITNVHGKLAGKPVEEYCDTASYDSVSPDKGYVVVFDSESMGSGDDDLGNILTRSLLASLSEADELPSAILLYNSGVKIAVKKSFVEKELIQLAQLGIPILLCETCLNFFNIRNDICVGVVSNMLEITDRMVSANKIIYS